MISLIGLAAPRRTSGLGGQNETPTVLLILQSVLRTLSIYTDSLSFLFHLNCSIFYLYKCYIHDLGKYYTLSPITLTVPASSHFKSAAPHEIFTTIASSRSLHRFFCKQSINYDSCGQQLEIELQAVYFPDAVQWQLRGGPRVVKIEYRPALRT